MTHRLTILVLVLAACSVAYALPTTTELPGSSPLPSYSLAALYGRP